MDVLRLDEDAMEVITNGGVPASATLRAAFTAHGATLAERNDGGWVIHAPRPVLAAVLQLVLGAHRQVLSVLPRGTALTQTLREEAARESRHPHRRKGDLRP